MLQSEDLALCEQIKNPFPTKISRKHFEKCEL
jgi:hypothetical protein